MRKILFACLVIFASCSASKDVDVSVTPAIMKVKNGHITFVKTGPAVALSDSLDGKAAFIITKNTGPTRLTRF